MTTVGYMIWFLATAVMTIAVLTIGTLVAAEVLPRRRNGRRPTTTTEQFDRGGGEYA